MAKDNNLWKKVRKNEFDNMISEAINEIFNMGNYCYNVYINSIYTDIVLSKKYAKRTFNSRGIKKLNKYLSSLTDSNVKVFKHKLCTNSKRIRLSVNYEIIEC